MPNDDTVPWQIAIDNKFWYKLYVEHHYWTLWSDAVNDDDEYNVYSDDIIAESIYSPYVLELQFIAESTESGVCLRNFSWTPLGGICLYRNSSSGIDTYYYTLNDFV